MTVITRRKARALSLRQPQFAFRAPRRFRIFSPAAGIVRTLFRYRRRRCRDENREDELRSCARRFRRKQSAGIQHLRLRDGVRLLISTGQSKRTWAELYGSV